MTQQDGSVLASSASDPIPATALSPDERSSQLVPWRHSGTKTRTSTATPLDRRLSHRPATEVAAQMLELHSERGTFFSETMLQQILSRLDSSLALTHATSAVASMLEGRLRPEFDSEARKSGLKDHTKAINAVRSSLSAEEPILLAINLLCYYELMTGFNVQVMKHHGRGLHSLLLADPGKWSRDAVGRTVLFATRLIAVEACIAAGRPSPFESDLWLQHDIPTHRSPDVAVLWKLAHKIFLNLPRLVHYLRLIREGEISFNTMCEAVNLAQQILLFKDDMIFASVLDSCEKVETISNVDRRFVPTSIYLPDVEAFDDFLDYVRARLTITTLCLALPQLIPDYTLHDHQYDQLRQEQLSSFDIILQCWQSCAETQRFAKSMCTAFFPLYGTLQQIESYHGIPAAQTIEWLELKSMIAFSHLNQFGGRRDLAATWEMYCGGPPEKSIYRDWAY